MNKFCSRTWERARPQWGLRPRTDVMIFKIFLPKNSAKKLAFLTQNKAKLCKIWIITLMFEKNAYFFAENCRKSQKIVIITSTPRILCGKNPECSRKIRLVTYLYSWLFSVHVAARSGVDHFLEESHYEKLMRTSFITSLAHSASHFCFVQGDQGPMFWYFKYVRRKVRRRNWCFWLKTKLNYAKKFHEISFWEKRQYFRRKSQKIVIITSTQDEFVKKSPKK
jgi:hypothetical protein